MKRTQLRTAFEIMLALVVGSTVRGYDPTMPDEYALFRVDTDGSVKARYHGEKRYAGTSADALAGLATWPNVEIYRERKT